MRRPMGGYVTPESFSLSTDLYEFTMAAGYFRHGRTEPATFELFVRDMGADRGYNIACGLEQALHGILNYTFTREQADYLRAQESFEHVPDAFFDALVDFTFEGDVWAMPEGTPFFSEEPILRVTAPLLQAQILETLMLTVMNFQSLIATKAARIMSVAREATVIDFGARRAHGPEAALLAARAAYAGGCHGTSNVLAGRSFGIPVLGTAAHSWTMAWKDEQESFERLREVFPDTVLLVDTYDTLRGVRRAIATGKGLGGVRLDSGDLGGLARQARALLDKAGETEAQIVASGGLNEYKIDRLLSDGAPIDAFGVGTRLVVSEDAPSLDGVYKLVDVDGRSVLKTSTGKRMLPGVKQVFRRMENGRAVGDTIARADESLDGEPLLQPCIENGELVADCPDLHAIRDRLARQMKRLPDGVKRIKDPDTYPVVPSDALQRDRDRVAERYETENGER